MRTVQAALLLGLDPVNSPPPLSAFYVPPPPPPLQHALNPSPFQRPLKTSLSQLHSQFSCFLLFPFTCPPSLKVTRASAGLSCCCAHCQASLHATASLSSAVHSERGGRESTKHMNIQLSIYKNQPKLNSKSSHRPMFERNYNLHQLSLTCDISKLCHKKERSAKQ